MTDLPGASGKMCNWEVVEAVEGAMDVLRHVSKVADIYIATGALDSTAQEIEAAFSRVGLSQFVAGYFCRENLGVEKGTSEFFPAIIDRLGQPASAIAMVGESNESIQGTAYNMHLFVRSLRSHYCTKRRILYAAPDLGVRRIGKSESSRCQIERKTKIESLLSLDPHRELGRQLL